MGLVITKKINNSLKRWNQITFCHDFYSTLALFVLALAFVCQKAQAPLSYHMNTDIKESYDAAEYSHSIEKNETLYSMLLGHGFTGQDVQQILKISKPYYDLSRLPSGLRYRLIYSNNPLISWNGIEFQLSPTKSLKFFKDEATQWQTKLSEHKVDVRVVSFVGTVQNSLWESARLAKMSPQLISQLTEIFGWELDFSRQVSVNDSWRLTVEQFLVKGRVVGWGRINIGTK